METWRQRERSLMYIYQNDKTVKMDFAHPIQNRACKMKKKPDRKTKKKALQWILLKRLTNNVHRDLLLKHIMYLAGRWHMGHGGLDQHSNPI